MTDTLLPVALMSTCLVSLGLYPPHGVQELVLDTILNLKPF